MSGKLALKRASWLPREPDIVVLDNWGLGLSDDRSYLTFWPGELATTGTPLKSLVRLTTCAWYFQTSAGEELIAAQSGFSTAACNNVVRDWVEDPANLDPRGFILFNKLGGKHLFLRHPNWGSGRSYLFLPPSSSWFSGARPVAVAISTSNLVRKNQRHLPASLSRLAGPSREGCLGGEERRQPV